MTELVIDHPIVENREHFSAGVPVLVVGIPGERSIQIAEAVSRNPDLRLISSSLTSQENGGNETMIHGRRVFLTSTMPLHSLIYYPERVAVDVSDDGVDYVSSLIRARIPFVTKNPVDMVAVRNSQICVVVMPDGENLIQNTLIAVPFLAEQMRNGSRGQLYSPADVLRGGL